MEKDKVARHSPHVTRHTSRVTRHSSNSRNRNEKGCAVGPCYLLTLSNRNPDAIGCKYKVTICCIFAVLAAASSMML